MSVATASDCLVYDPSATDKIVFEPGAADCLVFSLYAAIPFTDADLLTFTVTACRTLALEAEL